MSTEALKIEETSATSNAEVSSSLSSVGAYRGWRCAPMARLQAGFTCRSNGERYCGCWPLPRCGANKRENSESALITS